MTMKTKTTFISLMLLMVSALGCEAQPRYDFTQLQREELGRGVVAIRQSETETCLTWRYLSSDPLETSFNVYRDGSKVATVPAGEATMWVDERGGNNSVTYEVRPVVNGAENHQAVGKYTLPAEAPIGFLDIPLQRPEDGKTPSGQTYTYSANDASIGDVDGDGEYEIILKWDPSNAHDNAHDGYTGNVIFDCYRFNGERLWRIDLGRNVRAGAHYTQFMVYDLDGDNRAEIVMKTADGTIDGLGKVIGDADADWREHGDTVGQYQRMQEFERMRKEYEARMQAGGQPQGRGNDTPRMRPDGQRPQGGASRNNRQRFPSFTPQNQGRILRGSEYLTVFSGLTGEALCTIDYVPERGELQAWGDRQANRSDRYLACVAYLDGVHPSVVMCRGYYTRTVLAAFDWDGRELKQRWVFDSNGEGKQDYAGQGNHNLRVGDVDGDGCDEIIYGSMAVDNDGKGLYTTRMGHGDAMHLTAFFPDSDKLQVWDCHENRRDGSTFRNAATGEVIFQTPSDQDVGRCMAADIDPTSWGVEMWSLASGGIRNVKGEVVNAQPGRIPCNMAVWWDGDLLREMLDGNRVSKYNWLNGYCEELKTFEGTVRNNGTKSNPCLHADILGDWREEVLLRTEDNSSLRLYVSTIPTDYRFHTFLEDPVYRISIATQNVAYNQPTQPGFYFGPDLKPGLFRGFEIKGK